MTSLNYQASAHADRPDKGKNKFASGYYLRDMGYLYLVFILFIFILINNIYLQSMLSTFNSQSFDKPIKDTTYKRCMETVEMLMGISFDNIVQF